MLEGKGANNSKNRNELNPYNLSESHKRQEKKNKVCQRIQNKIKEAKQVRQFSK